MVNTRKKSKTQQLVIPRGLVGPNDIAVVEIPRRYRRLPVIVAKPHIILPRAEERAEEFFIDGPKGPQSNRTKPSQLTASSFKSSTPPSAVSASPTQQSSQNAPGSRSQSAAQTPSENAAAGSHQVVTFQNIPATCSRQNAAATGSPASQKTSTTSSGSPYEYPLMIPPCAVSIQAPCGMVVPIQQPSGSNSYSFNPVLSSTMTKSSKPVKVPTTRYTCEAASIPSCLKSSSSHSQYSNCDLTRKEILEKDNVRKSLEEFQEARRKFLNNANALAGKMRACYAKRDDDSSSSSSDDN